MKKVIVTGGGGFIGQAVVRLLAQRGVETAVVGRHRYPALADLNVTFFCGDIRDQHFLLQAFKGYDTVFHVAAKAGIWGAAQEYDEINVTGSRHVLQACRTNGIRNLIYTSSPSVVFNGEMAGVDEQAPYPNQFLCHYARTKALAEQLILHADSAELHTTALRPHLVWGPGDTNLIPRLIARGRSGQLKQVGEGANLVDISYIDNVAAAHLLAADNLEGPGTAAGKAYFISQGEPVNLWDWINDLFSRLKIPPVRRQVGFRQAYVAGMLLEGIFSLLRLQQEPAMTRFLAEQLAKSHYFSINRAREELGYLPAISTSEGLERTVAWAARL